MPSTSKAQHNAMEAAAHGHSTIGIPKSVGQEFVQADQRKALPGRSKSDKHPVIKRGEPITRDNLIGKWSAR